MRIIAVGGPKGGKGGTTTSVTMATIAARSGMNVLLVDGDRNRSAIDWAESGGDAIPVDVTAMSDPGELRELRRAGGYDLMVVDLPGARAGAFQTMLDGGAGEPVADLIVVPCQAEILDLRPTLRVVRSEIIPMGMAHLLVFTKVPSHALTRTAERQVELRGVGIAVATTIVRRYAVYDEAVERGVTVLDVPGRHSTARAAELDYRSLTAEVLTALDRATSTRPAAATTA